MKSSLCLWTQVVVDSSFCCSALCWLLELRPLWISMLSLQWSGTWKIRWSLWRTATSPLGFFILWAFIDAKVSCNWFLLMPFILFFMWLGCCTHWGLTIIQQRLIRQRVLQEHQLLRLRTSRVKIFDCVQALFERTNDPWRIRRCVLWSFT